MSTGSARDMHSSSVGRASRCGTWPPPAEAVWTLHGRPPRQCQLPSAAALLRSEGVHSSAPNARNKGTLVSVGREAALLTNRHASCTTLHLNFLHSVVVGGGGHHDEVDLCQLSTALQQYRAGGRRCAGGKASQPCTWATAPTHCPRQTPQLGSLPRACTHGWRRSVACARIHPLSQPASQALAPPATRLPTRLPTRPPTHLAAQHRQLLQPSKDVGRGEVCCFGDDAADDLQHAVVAVQRRQGGGPS